ncbi:kinesin-like protein KIF26B [Brienomyrus brachyistius]|uniref:kinesin-like protein KIF26B n=1 Tax=Brienomyrus brachyistius TaxID=42636 RepID=UPI0020B3DFD8|nr:kinesin-like protein KIF26B [Brienomyrus brachyistius]
MTSFTGNKDRCSATTRSRKHAIIDASPTKSASYSPETWYRKTYEESRAGNRPAPEGAGSIPSSSGTPSPGSGISSPGSFSGSPGTTSPGVCTGSPGSLGGSPGFGTGSPGSGSGSSPGSDRGVWCESCNARLIELKRQALKLLIPGPLSSKDPSLPSLLNEKLQVVNSTRKAWNERDARCDVCSTHLNQLKQEAVYMVLTLERAASLEPPDCSPGTPSPLTNLPSLVGPRNILQGAPPCSGTSVSHPAVTGPRVGFSRHGLKPSSLGVNDGAERRDSPSSHVGKPVAQLGVKPGAKSGAQPGSKPGVQPGPQLVAQPGAKLGAQPGVQPGAELGAQIVAQQGVQSGAKLGVQPGAKSGAQIGTQQGVQPGAKLGVQPGAKSGVQLGVQPGTKLGAQTGAQPGVQPGAQPGVQSGAKPGSQTGPKPVLQPGTKSGIQLGAKLGAQPAVQALTRPSSSPSSGSSNGSALSSVALQAHQYPESTWSASSGNGVTLYPCQVSQLLPDGGREGVTEAMNCCNADRPSAYSYPAPHTPLVTTAPSSGTSAAASFFVRAAQKLNLSSKKKKPRPAPPPMCDPPPFPTNFSGVLQTLPPPAPPCLLRAVSKVKDTPGLGKVKVMLRVCPLLPSETSESRSFLKVDPRKKQVTIMEPVASVPHGTPQKRSGGSQVPPRMFAFDATFPHEASQAEVCAGTVAEVVQSVVNGADGCVFCFGHTKLGKSYTMIGKDDSTQSLGIIPCTISWLFKLIDERKEKTGSRFSIRVSAVEVWGRDEVLKDLLSEVATGSLQDGQSPGIYLCEDPICGMQLQNQSELRAPSPEKAAFFLDAAMAARSSSRPDCSEEDHRMSHMLFTLHIYQYRMEKAGKGGMSGGRSRLHLIDLGSCAKVPSKTRDSPAGPCLSLTALGNVILALVNGSKHIPYKDSKLTMLLRESLGNINCRTTMIAHISSSPSNFSETLSTIQIASRVLRMKKKKTKQYTSSSSGGESSCEEGRMRRPTQLRTLHSRNVVDSDLPLLQLSSDPDDYSSSEQSCDTVIYVGPNGSALSDKELTDNEGPPEFVPIIPSLHKNKAERVRPSPQLTLDPQLIQQPQQQPSGDDSQLGKREQDCLKCNTFAELQERLECIDGSEEVSRFPFEEVPPTNVAKVEYSNSMIRNKLETRLGKLASYEQQLEETREVTVEAAITQSAICRLSQEAADSCELSPSRCVTGSSSNVGLTEGFTLHDSVESMSATSCSESKSRSVGSPRLGIASLTKTSEYRPASSSSQRCKVYTQKGTFPCTPLSSLQSLSKETERSSTESLLQLETRTSPVGMSSQILKRNSSSISLDSSDILSEVLLQPSLEKKRELKSNTTLTVQQPLELNGEDELVFSLVKEHNINAMTDDGRPTSIISFNSDCSVQALASGSRPVSIISSISEDLDHFTVTSSMTTTSAMTKLIPFSVEEDSSSEYSISSWLQDVSTSSHEDQAFSSVIVQPCCSQREASAEPLKPELSEVALSDGHIVIREGVTLGTDDCTRASKVNEKCPVSEDIPPIEKDMVGISNSQNLGNTKNIVTIEMNISDNPCDTAEPAAMQDSAEPISSVKMSQIKDVKMPPVPISSGMKFEDPWMKRGTDNIKLKENTCALKPEKKGSCSGINQSQNGRLGSIPGEAAYSAALKRVVDGSNIVINAPETLPPVHTAHVFRASSLPRGWCRASRQDNNEDPSNSYLYGEYNNLGITTSTPCSPKATLQKRGPSAKQGVFAQAKGIPPLPPIRKSSLDQKNRAGFQCVTSNTSTSSLTQSFLRYTTDDSGNCVKNKGPSGESSRLFSAKLEQLANRTNSLGRSYAGQYDRLPLERADSLTSVGSRSSTGKECSLPRLSRSLRRSSVSSTNNGHSNVNSNMLLSPKASPSKISAVSKLLMVSPKARSLSASSTRTLSFSTKSLPQSVNRSSSLPPNGKNQNQGSWSTQSLSRSRGSGLASKLPLRAVNGRISELLQGTIGSRARGPLDVEARAGLPGEEKQVASALPSPYSKITAPRKPHRCSSGHASDNSSILSGELPPAMGKTALFYHSGGSSGYESMMRDSEATGSTSSAQDSMSDKSSSVSGRRNAKNQKKRNNTGSQRRRLIPALSFDMTSPVRKQVLSPGGRWVDGPLRAGQRGPTDTFEIKVYEIDDVERLQRRRAAGSKEVIFFSAKLKILEHRQQRISEVRARYDWLKKELEQTKQHLMLAPEKWTSEFDLQQTFEVDSVEYLEALECVTGRLENCVNFCKAHLMMITCFDVTSRRR